jgi:hypothetical protein
MSIQSLRSLGEGSLALGLAKSACNQPLTSTLFVAGVGLLCYGAWKQRQYTLKLNGLIGKCQKLETEAQAFTSESALEDFDKSLLQKIESNLKETLPAIKELLSAVQEAAASLKTQLSPVFLGLMAQARLNPGSKQPRLTHPGSDGENRSEVAFLERLQQKMEEAEKKGVQCPALTKVLLKTKLQTVLKELKEQKPEQEETEKTAEKEAKEQIEQDYQQLAQWIEKLPHLLQSAEQELAQLAKLADHHQNTKLLRASVNEFKREDSVAKKQAHQQIWSAASGWRGSLCSAL